MTDSHQVLIVVGGTAGLTVASQLLERDDPPEVALLDPADTHYYQPLWTLIGAGVFPKEESARPMGEVMPRGATWIQDRAVELDPDNNAVTTAGGDTYGYDYLVMAAGIQINWDGIRGLAEPVGRPGTGGAGNYTYDGP